MITDSKALLTALKEAQEKCLAVVNGSVVTSSEPLFHYTDLNGCLSILETGKLRLTDVRYCNDPDEISGGLRILTKVHNEIISDFKDKDPVFAAIMTVLFHHLCVSTTFKEHEQELLEQAKKDLTDLGLSNSVFSNSQQSIFVACFSERSDDLRQWMPYADDGKGIALGFRGFDGYHYFESTSTDTYLVKASYAQDEKKENYVRQFYDYVFDIFKRIDLSLRADFVEWLRLAIFHDIIACKSKDYADEAEWRLFSIKPTHSTAQKFYISKNIIKPYTEISINKLSLLKIRLGPKAVDLNRYTLSSIASQLGYSNASVSKSLISYR